MGGDGPAHFSHTMGNKKKSQALRPHTNTALETPQGRLKNISLWDETGELLPKPVGQCTETYNRSSLRQ